MGSHTDVETFPLSLHPKDHGRLLDVIDLLRSQGINHYVRLPQLIVCGDQSSGKSSVLEAVSGVRFPTKENLCTRFATELVLRRDSVATATVAIVPSTQRSDKEKEKFLAFQAPTVRVDNFPSLIDAAKEAMGLGSGAKAFSDDVLRVEISGPAQPHLTLVDLPGLIHAEGKQQSAEDVQLVSSLVRSYMANTRSIIVAVVSAKNDRANQIVTKLARDVDPTGVRTIGIITKPDTLHVGSDSEKAFLDLAGNKEVMFRLGWHVLRNRDNDNRECSIEERDRQEREFLSQATWISLPPKTLGIGTLKPRLSTVLKDQIMSELPNLVFDIQVGIGKCRSTLVRLGEARGTLQEQRLYLVRVSQSFSSLIKAAVDGVYVHEFFGDAMTPAGFRKRLRAVVQDVQLEIARDMRREGLSQEITDEASPQKKVDAPNQISRSDFLDNVHELVRRSRGCELPGTFNSLMIGDLFYQQSKPWKRLVERYSERILDATRTSLELISLHTTNETTSEGLIREIIDPAMERYADRLGKQVAEILDPHQKGHPITYNHYFTETVQKARKEHAKKDQARQLNAFFKIKPGMGSSYVGPDQGFYTGELLEALNQRTEADIERYACSEAVDCMEAYYKVSANVNSSCKNEICQDLGPENPSRSGFERVNILMHLQVAMKVMLDNFAVLGIECCVLDRLFNTFSPHIVLELDDSLIRNIAAETEESQSERARTIKKLKSLEAGLQTLNRLNRSKPAGQLILHSCSLWLSQYFTRANAFVENEIDEALDRPEEDHEVTVKGVDADRNGELLWEQEAPVVNDVEASDAGKPELHELTWNLSLFHEDESIRADDSRLKNGSRTCKPKKDKKRARSNRRRVDYDSNDQLN